MNTLPSESRHRPRASRLMEDSCVVVALRLSHIVLFGREGLAVVPSGANPTTAKALELVVDDVREK